MSVQIQNNISIIGIDVSKHKLDMYLNTLDQHQSIDNNEKSIRQFIKQLTKQDGNVLIVMENTGGYERLAQTLFSKAEHGVHVAHATRVYYFAKQKGYFAKTDKIDAKILAQYAVQEQVLPTPLQSKQGYELKALSGRRHQLIDLLTTEKCRLKTHLCQLETRSLKRIIKQLEREIALLDKQTAKLVAADEETRDKVANL